MAQINFFMLDSDYDEFICMLMARRDTHVIPGRFFDRIDPRPIKAQSQLSGREITLVNAAIIPEPKCSGSGAGEFTGQFLFSIYQDPFIEMTRSVMIGDVLVPGRIYFKDIRRGQYVSNATTHQKWYA